MACDTICGASVGRGVSCVQINLVHGALDRQVRDDDQNVEEAERDQSHKAKRAERCPDPDARTNCGPDLLVLVSLPAGTRQADKPACSSTIAENTAITAVTTVISSRIGGLPASLRYAIHSSTHHPFFVGNSGVDGRMIPAGVPHVNVI